MLDLLTQHWWAWALRGVAAILFGVGVFIWPGAGVAVLVALFGAYALVSGIFALLGAAQTKNWNSAAWVMLIDGLLGVAAGIVTFIWPGVTALALLYVIASWALLTGILELFAAFHFHRVLGNGAAGLMGLGGLASIVFGAVLVARPGSGALTVIWLIGLYAVVFGVAMLTFGFRLRSLRQDLGISGHSGLTAVA